jgi:hypothetical protein
MELLEFKPLEQSAREDATLELEALLAVRRKDMVGDYPGLYDARKTAIAGLKKKLKYQVTTAATLMLLLL